MRQFLSYLSYWVKISIRIIKETLPYRRLYAKIINSLTILHSAWLQGSFRVAQFADVCFAYGLPAEVKRQAVAWIMPKAHERTFHLILYQSGHCDFAYKWCWFDAVKRHFSLSGFVSKLPISGKNPFQEKKGHCDRYLYFRGSFVSMASHVIDELLFIKRISSNVEQSDF